MDKLELYAMTHLSEECKRKIRPKFEEARLDISLKEWPKQHEATRSWFRVLYDRVITLRNAKEPNGENVPVHLNLTGVLFSNLRFKW